MEVKRSDGRRREIPSVASYSSVLCIGHGGSRTPRASGSLAPSVALDIKVRMGARKEIEAMIVLCS